MQIDRTGWPSGPWDSEPDHDHWHHLGYECFILRNRLGVWCGYVSIPRGHPWYQVEEFTIDVVAHGGLTWGDMESREFLDFLPSDPSRFTIGFDCGHASFDYVPGMFTDEIIEAFGKPLAFGMPGDHPDAYRTIDYAKEQTNFLAEQVRNAALAPLRHWRRRIMGVTV